MATNGGGAAQTRLADGLHLLDLGTQYIPRRALIEDGGDEVLRCPTPGVLVRTADGWFLLDTGLNREVASRPDRIETWFAWGECEFPGAGDPLLDALGACGVAPGDLVGAAVSHLHADHSGGLRHLEDGPPVAIQASELEHAMRSGADDGYWREDFDRPGIRWRPLDGDAELAAGIRAVATPGHTPGHMSFHVETEDAGSWLFAFDAILLTDNIEEGRPGGRTSPPGSPERMLQSQARLVALAEASDATLMPGHCPEWWARHATAAPSPRGGER
jgi:N-acyl homoserine lactone hydrolase